MKTICFSRNKQISSPVSSVDSATGISNHSGSESSTNNKTTKLDPSQFKFRNKNEIPEFKPKNPTHYSLVNNNNNSNLVMQKPILPQNLAPVTYTSGTLQMTTAMNVVNPVRATTPTEWNNPTKYLNVVADANTTNQVTLLEFFIHNFFG